MRKMKLVLFLSFVFISSACATSHITGDLTISGLRLDGESLYNSCRRWVEVAPVSIPFVEADNSMYDPSWSPAGKYGFVYADGAALKYTDTGETAKFFGTNWVYPNHWIENEQADVVVDRYKFMGIKLLRIHGMDANLYSTVVFDSGGTTTETLNESNLLKFDYAYAKYREAGIYFTFNIMHHSRSYRQDDGVEHWDHLYCDSPSCNCATSSYTCKSGGYLLIFWNDRIKELFELYASQILNRVNVYTGLAYKNDPALVAVEMVNEPWVERYWKNQEKYDNTIYIAHTGSLEHFPQEYLDEIDTAWNDWVEAKYGVGSAGVTAAKAAWGITDLSGNDGEDWDYNQTGFGFHRPPYKLCIKTPALGGYKQGPTGTHCTDIALFMKQSQENFYADEIIYLRSIGVQQLIITEGSYAEEFPDEGDAASLHNYFDIPSGSGGSFTQNGYSEIQSSGNLVNTLLTYYPRETGVKPEFCDESLLPNPNPYVYEVPLRQAARLLNGGYDSVLSLAYEGGLVTNLYGEFFTIDPLEPSLALYSLASWVFLNHDPGDITVTPTSSGANATGVEEHLATDYWAIMGNISGQTYSVAGMTITAGLNDGVIALYSKSGQPLETATDLMMLTAGQAQQRGAQWLDSSHYDWGQAGVVDMLPVGAKVQMADSSAVTVTPLSPDGAVLSPAITTYWKDGRTTFDICAEGNTVWYKITR